jgi:peptidoglycan hydrolase FlgJ
MTPTPIGRLTLTQQTADAQAPAPDKAAVSPEQLKAAKEFEAIFIRQLLSSLEKSSGISGGDKSGGAVFRSMMVSALSDTAAEGGGIGLRDLITRAMLPPAPQGRPDLSRAGASLPGASASEASASGTLGAAMAGASSHAKAALGAAFQAGAFDAAQPGPRLDPSSLHRVSERLGVTSRVLTQARPAPMLSTVAAGGEKLPTRPEGSK